MSKEREALKLALEALERHAELGLLAGATITAIREALAEQPAQQEPAAGVLEPIGILMKLEGDEHMKLYPLDDQPALQKPARTDTEWDGTLYKATMTFGKAQQQEPVDSAEKAGAYMEARLWEFIDMAAIWPEAKPDSRTWAHLMVYAPPASKPWVGLTDEEIDALAKMHFSKGIRTFKAAARAIETKLREKNAP